MDAPVWDVTVFTKNRDRLLEGDAAASFLVAIMADPASGWRSAARSSTGQKPC